MTQAVASGARRSPFLPPSRECCVPGADGERLHLAWGIGGCVWGGRMFRTHWLLMCVDMSLSPRAISSHICFSLPALKKLQIYI